MNGDTDAGAGPGARPEITNVVLAGVGTLDVLAPGKVILPVFLGLCALDGVVGGMLHHPGKVFFAHRGQVGIVERREHRDRQDPILLR